MKESKMKTSVVITTVITVHCLVVGAIILNQGCKTTRKTETGSSLPETKLPPAEITKEVPLPNPSPKPTVVPEKVPSETTEYVVQNGDSISVIAARYGLKSADIIALNNLTDPSKIRVGQRILLPGKVDVKSPKAVEIKKQVTNTLQAETGLPAETTGTKIHVVGKGEYLSKIAATYHVKVSDIKKANNLTSDLIIVGQKLKIPVKTLESKPFSENVENKTETEMQAKPYNKIFDSEKAENSKDISKNIVATEVVDSGKIHEVEEGDDLVTVAALWKVDIEDLIKLNNLKKDEVLKPGQKLKIPVPRAAANTN